MISPQCRFAQFNSELTVVIKAVRKQERLQHTCCQLNDVNNRTLFNHVTNMFLALYVQQFEAFVMFSFPHLTLNINTYVDYHL